MKERRNPNDIRRKFRELLDDRHFYYPSDKTRSHRMSWYLDGHLVDRPVNGLLAYANLAEYLLYRAKFGVETQAASLHAATVFFASTRRAMKNVLVTYPIGRRLGVKAKASISKVVANLAAEAVETYEAVNRSRGKCECPACRGKRLSRVDAELLEAVLAEASASGLISETSTLYRASPSRETDMNIFSRHR